MDSILTSIKKLLGITEDYEHFDTDIIMHINSVFMILTQLGVGPSEGFVITDKKAQWSDFIDDESQTLMMGVRSYMYMRVKLLFDPPQSGIVTDMMNKQINEFEWRLNVLVEPTPIPEDIDVTNIDYEKLKNLPSINGTKLIGNYDEKDPTIDKDELVDSVIEELPDGDEVNY
jgi:hypothetical protein